MAADTTASIMSRHSNRDVDSFKTPSRRLHKDAATSGKSVSGQAPGKYAAEDAIKSKTLAMLRRQARLARPEQAARPVQHGSLSNVAKRMFDIVGCVIGIVLLSPLLLGAAIAVKLSSPGPVLFCQKRYGKGGGLVMIYKFRTMKMASGDITGVQQTVRNDPRITRTGSILRKTSIDELPQLFNVLFGTMSIVGPRPHVPNMLAAGVRYEDFDVRYMDRFAVAPGITGLAQVNGYRGETSSEHAARMRLEYDLEYIRTRSVLMDFIIVLKTIRNEFLKGSGY